MSQLTDARLDRGDVVVRVKPEGLVDFFRLLKLDSELCFDMLLDVTAVDWMDQAEARFELVYHVLSTAKLHRLRVKVWVQESKPEIESLCPLWSGANFMEREVWDMYGIKFHGHPDLRRILMYEEFVGHPLRKDYPVQGKQPRVPLRHPEVENTARLMKRPALVQINKRAAGASEQEGSRR
ncbi:MAG: NADH-quinone oxidoreductase subunit C [Oligoflexia bacterium]|nr:NADH-quinone oxidoreductase subunit C [Oligoflexia bacterium]